MASTRSSHRYVLMVLSSGPGGIRSVVDGYERDGLFQRWNVRLLYPHVEGGILRRLIAAGGALISFGARLAMGRVRLVHCHVAMWGSFWRKSIFAELARLGRVPVIFHIHGSEMRLFFDRQGSIGKRLIRRQLQRVDRVLVLSESWKTFVEAISPGARVTILPNYVPLPFCSPQVRPSKGIRIIFLGLLGPRKGIYELLQAFNDVVHRIPDLTLMVAGNGDVAGVSRHVQALGLQDVVQVLGWISGADKEALLRDADIFVLPSHNEGLPVSILEAMSWGVAVVSTRVGGIPELVRDGQDGILIAAGDVPALAAALQKLASDACLRTRLGRSARMRVASSFAPDVILPKLDAIYADMLQVPARNGVAIGRTTRDSISRGD